MNWIQKIITYYKDNPEGYWFKQKIIGWGWMPVKWQGWLVTILSVALIVFGFYVGETDDAPGASLLGIVLAVILIFSFGYWKGEKLKWNFKTLTCYNLSMEKIKNNSILIIGVAVIIFSLVFFVSARDFSKQGSYAEVKGLSEKIVKADTAIWSLSFEVKSNDIDGLYAEIDRNITEIKDFLIDKGFDSSEINVASVNIYQDTYKEAKFRYNSNNQVSVYTKKVDIAKEASNETLFLIKKGVVLNQNYISFEFSDLNSIKPEMLAEAIKNARETASQFAKNSGSRVGRVTRGNQGVFEITEKDPGSPEYKKVRLVSTLRFLLK